MENNELRTVGSFVADDYRAAVVFQKHGIDFCCKGGRTIAEVCDKKNIPADQLLGELEALSAAPGSANMDFNTWPLDLLVDYIEKKHHNYVQTTTPVLIQFFEKLEKVHGINHPELIDINREFNLSAGELAMHMKKEELILFPAIRNLVLAEKKNEHVNMPEGFSVESPIQVMMNEHSVEGDRFGKMAAWSNQYTPPADACNTYRVAYSLLKEFEEDLHLHIHLENNILFPKAILLEKSFTLQQA